MNKGRRESFRAKTDELTINIQTLARILGRTFKHEIIELAENRKLMIDFIKLPKHLKYCAIAVDQDRTRLGRRPQLRSNLSARLPGS
jgi:hypothetical protein